MVTDSELLLLAITASLKAGKAILSVYHHTIEVTLKDDSSPLTQADLAAHQVLSELLTATGLPVLSEEASDVPFVIRKDWKRYWLIDPLDGTKEFIHRNGEFTVNIALIDEGKPVLGVVYAPVTDELYAGLVGEGAWYLATASSLRTISLADLMPLKSESPTEKNPDHPYCVAVSKSHMDEKTMEYLERLKSAKGGVMTIPAGSSMKLCLVAAGKADEYPRFGPTSEWDIAAGHAILLAVNRNVLSVDNQLPLKYNKPDLKNSGFVAK
jgi:3'(2'), 5'-bisphosphate nucleotidase